MDSLFCKRKKDGHLLVRFPARLTAFNIDSLVLHSTQTYKVSVCNCAHTKSVYIIALALSCYCCYLFLYCFKSGTTFNECSNSFYESLHFSLVFFCVSILFSFSLQLWGFECVDFMQAQTIIRFFASMRINF